MIENTDSEQLERANDRIVELLREKDAWMNDEWDPNAYHGGPLRAGDFPLSQRADYKGDGYYARKLKWPRRIFTVAFLICIGIYMGRHWL